ncbi:MAG: prohibitin family protein [Gammaproteobacteria bacterium]|nr:prohibitin family protein [Gammaproteobacteria bacterium]
MQRALVLPLARLGAAGLRALRSLTLGAWRARLRFAVAALLAAGIWLLYRHPPLATVQRSEIVVRTNSFDGSAHAYRAGTVLLLPGVHQIRRYPTRDQIYRPLESSSASGPAPFQSNEGLSIGVDLTVRWAIDRERIAQMAREYPDDLNNDLVRPAVQGVVYPLLARHTAREIFSSQREQIQQQIAEELRPKLGALGIVLRGVDLGQVDLPQNYRGQIEKLLAEELETEKVRYTLQLKEAQVKETQLSAEADKVRRQKAAEAAGVEQVIAARAQEETMQHILPFKQKQIEQRRLEAEAEKLARIRTAEGAAEARRIEARGEADSRQKLAEAEAYRLEIVGKSTAGQMEREGALIARYPLLIQKTLADKLSDKVQVIIAPTPAAGQFLGANLLGEESAPGAHPTPMTVTARAPGP